MEDILALVDEAIEEHQKIFRCVVDSQTIADDVCASLWLEQAKEHVMPGRLEDQSQGLRKLQDSMDTLEKRLEEHFQREEKALLAAFKRLGNKALASALHALLTEHKEIRHRINRLKKDVAELLSERSSRHIWQGKVWGLRAYMRHTAKLLEAHAESEQELLLQAKEELLGTAKQD